MDKLSAPSMLQLLEQAISEPGLMSAAYRAFHQYSFGNQLLAWSQCVERGIAPGPMTTFRGWQKKQRYVMKGQKAIILCQPVTVKTEETPDEAARAFTRFIYRPHWFVLAQTDGEAISPDPCADWSAARALQVLDIAEMPFAMMDGNCQGYAQERSIAINPVAAHPHKTRFHELAHVVLGHTAEGPLTDSEKTPTCLREVEAEAVALLCLEALDLPGAAYCRGYIQHWNESRGHAPIDEKSATRILKATDQIIKAGKPPIARDE